MHHLHEAKFGNAKQGGAGQSKAVQWRRGGGGQSRAGLGNARQCREIWERAGQGSGRAGAGSGWMRRA